MGNNRILCIRYETVTLIRVEVGIVLKEIGTRGGKTSGITREGSGQMREGAWEVDTSLYTRKMYVNQGKSRGRMEGLGMTEEWC